MMQQMFLGMGAVKNDVHLAVAHGSSPYITVYPFDNGFGTKISDPSTLPAGNGQAVAFSPNKKYIAVTHSSSPYVSVYNWSNNGFGAKVSDPSPALGTTPQEVRWSPDGNVIAFGVNNGNGVFAFYAWTGSGFGSKYTNPSQSDINECYAIRWTPSGDYVLVGGSKPSGSAKPVAAYVWDNSSGFGTKYQPGTGPTDRVTCINFHPDGDYVVVAQAGASIFCRTYPWTDSGDRFGNNISAPSDKWDDDAEQAQWTYAGNDVAFGGAGSPYVAVWPWSSGSYGTKYSNPSSLPSGFVYGLGIALDDSAVVVGSTFGDKLQGYPFSSGTGLGTKYSNPSTLPAGNSRKVDFL